MTVEISLLWSDYYLRLKRFVANRIQNQADVEDIVQDVFIKINDHIDDLKDEQKLSSWIYQIARNSMVDYFRKKKWDDELPAQLQITDEYEEPDLAQEVIACFESVIQQLPEKYKEAVELSMLKGMSQKELSERLGISYSGAKSRVQRGREMLKELLTGCCHIESDRYGNIIDFQIKWRYPSCSSNE
ncbi:RNA polymerase sigma factor SigZ [Paenibacillus sp. H1-7]|uniref:RNA polymerase sigma factor SigZ n=1 Tax=Paenibacillus sp. H1-7 TaxID=2282849 RepID=UPI001EF7F790|nr:RNA polymerase sigma factor SigZ [Paenibacillus sp. H1-7]ULL14738.1 RNA polymerase sigma factor SigZ [Paenibacillus sp. H1-7]